MKNLEKIIINILILTWLGLCCTTLKAEVVITEFFILQADNSHAPQYVELYNNSNSTISLENWSITTLFGDGEVILQNPFYENISDTLFNLVKINNLEIKPFGYFLISSSFCDYSTFGCNFYSEFQSDIVAFYLYLPLDGKGSVILNDNNNVVIDKIDYDIDTGWPVGEESRGRSLRLHVAPDTVDNDDYNNWSLSPETENSLWLYTENTEIKNFGSPREENSFRLNNIRYSDEWFSNIEIVTGSTHIIYGDYNDSYRAEPFVDDNGNGKWNVEEEYHDRNQNDIWDYQNNNYGHSLEFSWFGTFIDTPDLKYEIIIDKRIIEKNGSPIIDPIWENVPNLSWEYITDPEIPILPFDLLIDSMGQDREIADFTWTVELTKIFSDNTIDVIYSDKYTFTIDASDYGIYGCVDDAHCNENSVCPTSAFFDEVFISNHPLECVPGENCFSAINYYVDANINSKTCHYVSLSIPAFVVGDESSIAPVPVYLYNDSLANIDSIAYTLSFDSSAVIISYENGTFSGTVISELDDEYINYDGPDSISVNGALSEEEIIFQGAGIITKLNFKLIGSPGEFISLTISEVRVKGGIPENDISVPVKGGEIVILQTDYEISGQVYYYDSSTGEEPFEVPNVELTLEKKYDGVAFAAESSKITNEFGYFKFDLLTEGNYNLSFSKESTNDCNGNYISGTDISDISRHVIGAELFNPDQIIAADLSLDGTVSGLDASLAAQYLVGLIDNFNDINVHWIFQPFDLQTLPNVHAELLKINGQYSIKYNPLVLDDKSRNISAYRLGDVNGNYCHDQLSRFNNNSAQFTNIAIDYKPVITLPIIISEPSFIEGMDIEIGYDQDVFCPLSITFIPSNIGTEKYNSVSNLLSRVGSIKTVTWATNEPQLIEGIIANVSFEWLDKNKSGKIWLKNFQVNDKPAFGGISLIGLSDTEVTDGVNIINNLVPEELSLHQNYPNPFNPQTTINWSMPHPGMVSITIYNLQGQNIDNLFYGFKDAGTHEQIWDASILPSGTYFYRMTLNKTTLQKKMLLLK